MNNIIISAACAGLLAVGCSSTQTNQGASADVDNSGGYTTGTMSAPADMDANKATNETDKATMETDEAPPDSDMDSTKDTDESSTPDL